MPAESVRRVRTCGNLWRRAGSSRTRPPKEPSLNVLKSIEKHMEKMVEGPLRPRLQVQRAAGRAGSQAGQGDERPQDRQRVARLRSQRVRGLPLAGRLRAVELLRRSARRRPGELPRGLRQPRELDPGRPAAHHAALRRRPRSRRIRHRRAHERSGGTPASTPSSSWRRPSARSPSRPSDSLRRSSFSRRRGRRRHPRPAPAAPVRRAGARRARLQASRAPATVLGRSRQCDVVINDPNVSRRHAEVRREGDEYVLVDLDSTNGHHA